MADDPRDYGLGAEDDRHRPPQSAREALEPEPVPQPPRPSERARHPVVVFLNGLITALILLVLAGGAALYLGKQRFDAPGPLTSEKTVVVARGMDVQSIADMLARNGVISNKWIFVAGVRIYSLHGQLKAGEYAFRPGQSMHEVMATLVQGRSLLHSLTLPEGLTSKQIVERLNANEILSGGIGEIPAEGSLLPETYKFDRGTTRAELIGRLAEAHKRAVEEAWEHRADDLPLSSPEELVTLASIVEKETGRVDEQPRVAAVFLNRLRRGMPLQSDPTVLYGLYGGDAWKEPRTLTRSELEKPTPYNTYLNRGLPPGPISNPGRRALEAVANPSRTDELFFVADGSGGHVFARTIAEHNRNVARWRQIERARAALREQAPAPAAAAALVAGAPATDPAPIGDPTVGERFRPVYGVAEGGRPPLPPPSPRRAATSE